MKFEFLEHTADIKFQAFGKSLEEVFANSALAMFNSMFDGKVKRKKKERFSFQLEGGGLEGALYRFLEEFLVLFDSKGFFLGEIKKLKIEEKSGAYFIECEFVGDKAKNYKISLDVKAITYSEMFVKQEKGKWISQVVLDV